MSPFKVGDRVRVYGPAQSFLNGSYTEYDGQRGAYTNDVMVAFGHRIRVKLDTGEEINVSPKQCRRLLPAKPKRTIWVHENALKENRIGLDWMVNLEYPVNDRGAWVEFREVRKKVAAQGSEGKK